MARSITEHMLEARRWRAESSGEEVPDVAEHEAIHAFEVVRELGEEGGEREGGGIDEGKGGGGGVHGEDGSPVWG